MIEETHYHTIEKESVAEFKDRGSRFLGFAFPIESLEDFKKRLKNLKEEHPKAAHHCFAYRVGCMEIILDPLMMANRPVQQENQFLDK